MSAYTMLRMRTLDGMNESINMHMHIDFYILGWMAPMLYRPMLLMVMLQILGRLNALPDCWLCNVTEFDKIRAGSAAHMHIYI